MIPIHVSYTPSKSTLEHIAIQITLGLCEKMHLCKCASRAFSLFQDTDLDSTQEHERAARTPDVSFLALLARESSISVWC